MTKLDNIKKLTFMIFLVVAISCSDNNLQRVEKNDPTLTNGGRLKFKDLNALGDFINSTKENGRVNIEEIKKRTEKLGFKSHRENYYEKAEAVGKVRAYARMFDQPIPIDEVPNGEIPPSDVPSGGFPIYDEISHYVSPTQEITRLAPIEDSELAAVLNEDQEIQFGNSVARVQNDYTFVFDEGNTDLITDYYRALSLGQAQIPVGESEVNFGGLKVYKTSVKVISLASGIEDTDGELSGRRDAICGLHYRSDVRMEGKLISTWVFFYSPGRIETKVIQRKRSCFLWWCSDKWNNNIFANRLAMNFDIYVFFNGGIAARHTKSLSLTNGYLNNYSLGSLYGFNVARFDFSGWSCHSATWQGTTLSCTNRFFDIPTLSYQPVVCP